MRDQLEHTSFLIENPQENPQKHNGSSSEADCGEERSLAPLAESAIERQRQHRQESEHAFESWWKIYPNSQKRPDTYKAWLKAIQKITPEELKIATTRYAQAVVTSGMDRRYIPYSSTWLNSERWADPLPEPDRRRTADDRFFAALAAGAELDAELSHDAPGNGSRINGAALIPANPLPTMRIEEKRVSVDLRTTKSVSANGSSRWADEDRRIAEIIALGAKLDIDSSGGDPS